ncbi:MAG TPA: hypothetical protein VHV29_16720 [Terriglobales bacterium]|nr:hypothetical protein [Terriglobales bacterium]
MSETAPALVARRKHITHWAATTIRAAQCTSDGYVGTAAIGCPVEQRSTFLTSSKTMEPVQIQRQPRAAVPTWPLLGAYN